MYRSLAHRMFCFYSSRFLLVFLMAILRFPLIASTLLPPEKPRYGEAACGSSKIERHRVALEKQGEGAGPAGESLLDRNEWSSPERWIFIYTRKRGHGPRSRNAKVLRKGTGGSETPARRIRRKVSRRNRLFGKAYDAEYTLGKAGRFILGGGTRYGLL